MERQYLDLVQKIIDEGVLKGNRTGVDTLSVFGAQMRWHLTDSFPLLTTRRIFFRGILEELLWFISGSTNAKELSQKRVKIWDANGSKEFLEKRGLGYREEGDLGPVYGFQWRHSGEKYRDMHYSSYGGVDQLADTIQKIKTTPNDRTMIVCAWNPKDLPEMALPPCHCLFQFYVANGKLSCQLYQRSADMGLGVPFNIASYALLTLMVAKVTNLQPGDFVHTFGDAHVYVNHIDALKIQLKRTPRPFPKIKIADRSCIDDFVVEDFCLEDYNPHGIIKMDMAI